MPINRPMKAPTDPITDSELKTLHYPVVGSPKLDGFRCIIDGVPLTSSMKPFTNRFVAEELKKPVYNSLDGEIIVGSPFKENEEDDVFYRTSGPVRRFDGKPDFTFYVFDSWKDGHLTYQKRWIQAPKLKDNRIVVLEQRLLHNSDEVISFEQEMVGLGYEGAMIRSLDGKYKEGRCTLKEMNIFKRKPFEECEAEIIGVEEQMANLNEAVIDSRGLSKRSSHQANLVPKGTLGKFILQSHSFNKSFKAAPGKGFDAKKRQEIWDNKEAYIGQIVTVKYQKYGSIDAPRQPNVIKIRPSWDLQI
jgi:DNA ligase-1